MRITDFLNKNSVYINVEAENKDSIIDKLINLIERSGNLLDRDELKKQIQNREEQCSTGVGNGIAIPHAKTNAVKSPCVAAAVCKNGVDYEALDNLPSHLFFMIAVPECANNEHLEVLSKLSTMLMDDDFKNSLINSGSIDEFLKLIDRKERERFPTQKLKSPAQNVQNVISQSELLENEVKQVQISENEISKTENSTEKISNSKRQSKKSPKQKSPKKRVSKSKSSKLIIEAPEKPVEELKKELEEVQIEEKRLKKEIKKAEILDKKFKKQLKKQEFKLKKENEKQELKLKKQNDKEEKLLKAQAKKDALKLKKENEIEELRLKKEYKKLEQQEQKKSKANNKENPQEDFTFPKILCVTACPTGIAHTFMAAESLEKQGKKMGISIKVETNGSSGIKNLLMEDEIKNCDGIIVAADKKVEMSRFHGKRVIQTKVSDGIHKPEELISKILNGEAPIYKSSESNETSEKSDHKESFGRRFYKDLMNGVSNMLPFVVAGGILIAIAFLLDNYEIDPKNFGSNTPVAAFFKSIGDAAFGFLLPVLAGFIATSIADRPALVVGFVGGFLANKNGTGFLGALIAGFIAGYILLILKFIFKILPKSLEGIKPILLYPLLGTLLIGAIMVFGINPPLASLNENLVNFLDSLGTSSKILLGIVVAGMMAIDMGGPINKAAYVFGIASLESGNFGVMAAVMAGGMVPPLIIALTTTIFKNRFSKEERNAGKANYVMGLSFITEGAIPFAASDPLKVIPSCAIGSAISGALSMMFDCTLRAPHGGIFVFPIVGNWLMYLLSIIVGTVIGTFILGFLKGLKK